MLTCPFQKVEPNIIWSFIIIMSSWTRLQDQTPNNSPALMLHSLVNYPGWLTTLAG